MRESVGVVCYSRPFASRVAEGDYSTLHAAEKAGHAALWPGSALQQERNANAIVEPVHHVSITLIKA